jgi:hypothetical protein
MQKGTMNRKLWIHMFLLFWSRTHGRALLEEDWKRAVASANYLEVLVDENEATLAELNRLCGVKNNIFFGTIIPRKRDPIVTLEVDRDEGGP